MLGPARRLCPRLFVPWQALFEPAQPIEDVQQQHQQWQQRQQGERGHRRQGG
jgi:hypothetical protein